MEAGREFDAQVHRALWPKANIGYREYSENQYCEPVWGWFADGKHIPFYTTDLAAWDGVREGWMWEINESTYRVQVILRITPYHGDYIYAEVAYAECGGDHHAAWALGMSQVVLQWAERGRDERAS